MSFDINDPADLLSLKNEIANDPLGLGYSTENTQTDLDLINVKRVTITVSKPEISSALIRSTCTYDAYNNLAIDEQEWIRWITPGAKGEEDLTVTADLKTRITGPDAASIWAVADRVVMNAAMLDLIDVDGSRAEELFGFNASISLLDWVTARAS